MTMANVIADVGFKDQKEFDDFFIAIFGRLGFDDVLLSSSQRARRELKRALIDYYGGICICCGSYHWEFLCIDHMNGGGTQHRKEIGEDFYRWLVKQGCPKEGYRVLCVNCNFSIGHYGYCPHGNLYDQEEGVVP